MMSTAILMSMGAEQSTKRPVAQEADKFEGPTFAQALDARVSIPSETVGKDPAAGAPPELRSTNAEATPGTNTLNLEASGGSSAALVEKGSVAGTLHERSTPKSELVTKNLIDVSELTAVGKAKTFAGQVASNGAASKEITAGKSSPSQTVAVVEPQVLGETEDSGTQVAELSGNTEEITGETLTGPPGAASSTQTGEVNPAEEQRDENQILIPSLATPVASKGFATTGTAPETATAKKTIKTQGSDATAAAASKGGTTAVHAMTDEAKPAQGVVIQVPAPLSGQTGAYVAPIGSHNAVSSGAAYGAAPVSATASNTTSIAGTTPAADGSSHKNLVQSTRASASNTEATPAASADPTGTTKIDVRAERSSAVGGNQAGDGDGKGRTAGESLVASIHSVATGSDAVVPSGVTGLVKLPNGESGVQTSGPTTGLREQDGSGAVARSLEPMPRTLSATPTALEVGIPDGTHGWLKVRAEMTDGGVVNASVSAASSASQEMLHRELPSLTAYLQTEKVAVNLVVIHSTAGTGADSRGYSAGTESGANGQPPQGSNEGGEQRQSSVNAATEVTEDVSSYQELRGVGEDGTLPLTVYEGGGSWLSVRA